jgi:glucose 1-dehydrogenase
MPDLEINRAARERPEALGRPLTPIPYGRIGRPEDVARAAAGLAPDASDRVTGTAVFVDGDMTLHLGACDNG